ncbi:MAG: hypothetical protein JW885_15280 [Deltaproteobacteria bacterium]|nr:hypothetical protein [Candidatus Zymogenaceae bacterium]
MQIIEVVDKRDLKDFVKFPFDLYRDHPVWVPPLRIMANREFDRKKNGFFEHADAAFFMVKDGDRVLGRIAAFINLNYLKHYDDKVGFFGSFESVDDQEVARLLVHGACDWLKERGMDLIRGPYNFTSQSTGCLIEGFDQAQICLSPYNYPYYDRILRSTELVKIRDLNAYYGDSLERYTFPDRFTRYAELLMKRYGVTVRTLQKMRLHDDILDLIRVGNQASSGNWGFVPADEAEVDEIVRSFKPVMDPDAVFLMYKGETPIGYAIALPDINRIIKKLDGRLFPFGIFRLKYGVKRLREYRLLGLGLVPQYQSKALDTLLYYSIFKSLIKKHARLEANWVLESNYKMNHALVKLNMKLTKRYRLYQKPLD